MTFAQYGLILIRLLSLLRHVDRAPEHLLPDCVALTTGRSKILGYPNPSRGCMASLSYICTFLGFIRVLWLDGISWRHVAGLSTNSNYSTTVQQLFPPYKDDEFGLPQKLPLLKLISVMDGRSSMHSGFFRFRSYDATKNTASYVIFDTTINSK